MANKAKRIDTGVYSYRGYEIEYYPEIKAWNIFEMVPCTWGGNEMVREYAQTWNTLRECKSWVDWDIENKKGNS